MRTRAEHIAKLESDIATHQSMLADNPNNWPGEECTRQRHSWAKILHQLISNDLSKLARLRDKDKRQSMRGKRA